jgi:molybdate transport system substrate-binding protein
MSGVMELKVIASMAVKGAYLELVPAFEKRTGHKVHTHWVGMADIRKRMQAGDVSDVVIGSAALVDELTRTRVLAEERVDLAKSGIGAAVRAAAPRPEIGSVEALKRALRSAKSIVYSSGPSGVYLVELFKRLGIAEELKSKATQMPPGVLVAEVVARGDAELCFQQLPELRQVPGISYVGPLPPEVQHVTVFSGAVHSKAPQPQAGKALLAFLASPEASAVMRKHGFD